MRVPFHRPSIDHTDIDAVTEVLRSGWLTTGKETEAFERELAERTGVPHVVATSSGTAALDLALATLRIGANDEVVTTPYTFVATIESILRDFASPVLVDVCRETGNIDVGAVEAGISPLTRAVVAVHVGGHPVDLPRLRALCDEHGLALIADAAHGLECSIGGRPAAAWTDASAFSFYANKNMTTGEGGAVTFRSAEHAARARILRHHGMSRDAWGREDGDASFTPYDVVEYGMKANPSDLASALGRSQLARIDAWRARRRAIVARYDEAFADLPGVIRPPHAEADGHAWHLYMLRWLTGRDEAIRALGARGIGTAVHYRPVHTFSIHRPTLGLIEHPNAEALAAEVVSLPLFPAMTDDEVDAVIAAVREVAA